ncbi:MAG TPA: adenylate/guanylate cyclase domain-containing protein [Terrimesophilobacter sp.]|nr:adenylate/guanylate cyclase domain-containing protein [Terrimesophilobacter sp.]
MSRTEPTPQRADGAVRTSSRRAGLSIQSALLIMLLLVSLLSSFVVGLIGYVNGSDSLRDAAFDRLVGVRDARAREVSELFTRIKNTMLLEGRSAETIDATQAFTEGFAALEDTELTEDERIAIRAYFSGPFARRLGDATGHIIDAASFVPSGAAQSYLQLHYTIPFDDFDASIETVDAGDGSEWSAANARYHEQFHRMTQLLEFEDVLLIDTKGNVVYSAYKGVDLGTNLVDGPYAFSNLATAYAKALSTNILDTVEFTDFGEYPPSLGRPAAWAVSPVGSDGQAIGAIAVEMPIDAINSVMTGDLQWSAKGLGDTGETYLVGGDHLMRSASREVVEHPEDYVRKAVATGTKPDVADRVVETGSTLLLQQIDTDAVSHALNSETGTLIGNNYLGEESLAAYTPVRVGDLDWVIVAEIGTTEAFAPVREFTRNLVLSSTALIIVVALLSLVLAQLIVRPLRRLKTAAGRIAAGEQGVQVDAGRSDELADVGTAFNDMSRSLQVKASLLDEQIAENERLLLTLMPPTVAKRYRDGDQNIVEDHKEVTVLYADIVGFDEYSRNLPSEKALEQLNELLRSFDEAADLHGVERVRTTRSGYLASCGLTIPRVDNARRTVDLAVELQLILERFGAQLGASLNLRAGIDTGTVTSGLVGRSHIVYDLWGDAVSLAFRVQGETAEPGIFLTQRVVDKLPGSQSLVSVGLLQTTKGEQRVWRVDLSGRHV